MSGDRKDDWCALEELAVGWAMHALEPDEEAVLRAHLPDCDSCQRAVRSTEEVTAALGGSVRQFEPPARLKARLMAAIDDTPQEPVVSRVRPRQARRHVAEPVPLDSRRPKSVNRSRTLFAAAAVILVAILVGVVGQRYAALSDQVAAQTTRTDQLEAALRLAADPATNRAVLNTTSGDPRAVLLSGDDDAAVMPMALSPNDISKQIYVVWGTSGNGPVPLATFDVEPGSEIRPLAWSKAAHAHNGFAISLESGRKMPDAPSTVLAAGQVDKA